ncbi:MAG TPA: hypothetical protein VFA84_04840 [Acidimicrobiales bacterium]|nr:hypothetical protein [Acidimicrobiales bacterium]
MRLTDSQRLLLTRLPAACAVVLTLDDCGIPIAEISRRMALPAAAVHALIVLSTVRLAALEHHGPCLRTFRLTDFEADDDT